MFKDMGAVVQAQKALRPKVVKASGSMLPENKLLRGAVMASPATVGAIETNRLMASP